MFSLGSKKINFLDIYASKFLNCHYDTWRKATKTRWRYDAWTTLMITQEGGGGVKLQPSTAFIHRKTIGRKKLLQCINRAKTNSWPVRVGNKPSQCEELPRLTRRACWEQLHWGTAWSEPITQRKIKGKKKKRKHCDQETKFSMLPDLYKLWYPKMQNCGVKSATLSAAYNACNWNKPTEQNVSCRN